MLILPNLVIYLIVAVSWAMVLYGLYHDFIRRYPPPKWLVARWLGTVLFNVIVTLYALS